MNLERELEATRLYLQLVKKALTDLEMAQTGINSFIAGTPLRDIYRGLRTTKAHRTATEILVHTENLNREIGELERSLKDSEAILIQQANYYEQRLKKSSR